MIDILTHVAVGAVCLALGTFLARSDHREWLSSLRSEAMSGRIEQAKRRGADRAAEQARMQVLGWDQPTEEGVRRLEPPRLWMLPVPDRVVRHVEPEPLPPEPVRTAEQIMADFPPLPPIPSWREQVTATTKAAASPLYAETQAAVPVAAVDAELLVPPYDPAPQDWGDLHDVEATPDDDGEVPQDEARVTVRGRDDGDPPAGPPPSEPPDSPQDDVTKTAPQVAVAVYRHDWSRAQHPVGPLHGARPHPALARDAGQWMASRTKEAWARIWAAPQVQVQRSRWWRRLRYRLAVWWAESVAAEINQGWAPEELGDGHLIARHRRRGGTWQVA